MSYNCQHWECRWQNYCVKRKIGWGWILFHIFMVFATAGIWIVPLFVWFLVRRAQT